MDVRLTARRFGVSEFEDANGVTCSIQESSAIPPRDLKGIVEDAIMNRIDMDVYDDVLAQEKVIRESLTERLANI